MNGIVNEYLEETTEAVNYYFCWYEAKSKILAIRT